MFGKSCLQFASAAQIYSMASFTFYCTISHRNNDSLIHHTVSTSNCFSYIDHKTMDDNNIHYFCTKYSYLRFSTFSIMFLERKLVHLMYNVYIVIHIENMFICIIMND